MKMTKYFALVLILLTGQAMAGPHNGHQSDNNWQIRTDAQRLIHAQRSLLVSINYYGAGYNHVSRDVTLLIRKTVRLRNSADYGRSRHVMRIQMRNIRVQLNHVRRSIVRNRRLRHARVISHKVRKIAFKTRILSRDVYSAPHRAYY